MRRLDRQGEEERPVPWTILFEVGERQVEQPVGLVAFQAQRRRRIVGEVPRVVEGISELEAPPIVPAAPVARRYGRPAGLRQVQPAADAIGGIKVPLADIGGGISLGSHRLAQRPLRRGKPIAQRRHIAGVGVFARHKGEPEWHARRKGRAGGGEINSLARQPVDVGRSHIGVAGNAQRVATQLVDKHQDDIRLLRHRLAVSQNPLRPATACRMTGRADNGRRQPDRGLSASYDSILSSESGTTSKSAGPTEFAIDRTVPGAPA